MFASQNRIALGAYNVKCDLHRLFVISIIIFGKINVTNIIAYLHNCKVHHIMITFWSHSSRT